MYIVGKLKGSSHRRSLHERDGLVGGPRGPYGAALGRREVGTDTDDWHPKIAPTKGT